MRYTKRLTKWPRSAARWPCVCHVTGHLFIQSFCRPFIDMFAGRESLPAAGRSAGPTAMYRTYDCWQPDRYVDDAVATECASPQSSNNGTRNDRAHTVITSVTW